MSPRTPTRRALTLRPTPTTGPTLIPAPHKVARPSATASRLATSVSPAKKTAVPSHQSPSLSLSQSAHKFTNEVAPMLEKLGEKSLHAAGQVVGAVGKQAGNFTAGVGDWVSDNAHCAKAVLQHPLNTVAAVGGMALHPITSSAQIAHSIASDFKKTAAKHGVAGAIGRAVPDAIFLAAGVGVAAAGARAGVCCILRAGTRAAVETGGRLAAETGAESVVEAATRSAVKNGARVATEGASTASRPIGRLGNLVLDKPRALPGAAQALEAEKARYLRAAEIGQRMRQAAAPGARSSVAPMAPKLSLVKPFLAESAATDVGAHAARSLGSLVDMVL